nr:hypothetical protein [Streptomyces viridochromogenes]
MSADCDHAPREIITHGQDGLMVPDDGPVEDALADALCRLIENDAERRRMAAAARRSAERFRPEHIAAQYEALFTALRPGRGSRSMSKPTAGPRLRSRLLGLTVARVGQPVTVGCRVLPGGSLASQLPEGRPVPAGWKLVLHPRTDTFAATPQLPLEQPDTGGDGRVRAVLDTRHRELAEGDFDVLLQRAGGSR